eukprot:3476848-Alexandrium_andersonii.AAC.1
MPLGRGHAQSRRVASAPCPPVGSTSGATCVGGTPLPCCPTPSVRSATLLLQLLTRSSSLVQSF